MSALDRFSDSSRTSPEVRVVPGADISRLFDHLVGDGEDELRTTTPLSTWGSKILPIFTTFEKIIECRETVLLRYVGDLMSRTGAVAWAMWQHSVSCPRSSNRTCRFPASGFPTSFILRHTEKSSGRKRPLRGGFSPSPYDTAFSEGSGSFPVL